MYFLLIDIHNSRFLSIAKKILHYTKFMHFMVSLLFLLIKIVVLILPLLLVLRLSLIPPPPPPLSLLIQQWNNMLRIIPNSRALVIYCNITFCQWTIFSGSSIGKQYFENCLNFKALVIYCNDVTFH